MTALSTPIADWIVVLPVVLALLGAALLLMPMRSRLPLGGLAILVTAAICANDVLLFMRVFADGPLAMTMGKWLPPFGISFSADVMGAAFALAGAFVTLVVLFYLAVGEPRGDREQGLYPLILLLLAGISGAFLTGDLFNLYVWFEVMLIASFGLLAGGGRAIQLDATVKYGFLNFLATTLFLMALGLLYGLLGTLNMADIALSAPKAAPAAMAGIGALFLLAFGTKAAAFPVNTWLPASYHAPPAALSALLAGLLTKVGVYALLRTLVALLPGARETLEPAIAVIAIATMLLAPLGAIAETNLRRAIGFMVIGGIGIALSGLALPSQAGLAGATLYVFHAILTMTALYLVAGLAEKLTGETDSRRMGGLYAASAPVSILFLVAVLAASGVPPFLGFWPKLLLLQAGAGNAGLVGIALVVALLVNALLTLIAGTRLWAHIFWRQKPDRAVPPAVSAGLASVPAAILVAAIVLAGLWPDLPVAAANAAASGLIDPAQYIAAVGLGGAP